MLACGHQVGFNRAQRPLVGPSVFITDLLPARPPAGADHVETSRVDLSKVAVPYVSVGVFKIQPLYLAGHGGGSDNRQGTTIEFKKILVHRQARTGTQKGLAPDPKSAMINDSSLAALPQFSLKDQKSLDGAIGRNHRQ